MEESDKDNILIARSAALVELSIATVATGTPFGICTIENNASCPPRQVPDIGTPMTGRQVIEAIIPGKWAAPPAPAMIIFSPFSLAHYGYQSRVDLTLAYSNIKSGVLCAETISNSKGIWNNSKSFAASTSIKKKKETLTLHFW